MSLLALSLLLQSVSGQYCPCYTLNSSGNTLNCGVSAVNGTNPSVADWQPIFNLVAQGPSGWGTNGPAVGNLGNGCGKPTPNTQQPAKFPCELLKAISMAETGWRQFCVPTTPSDQVGGPSRTIISFDCGYGIGQVTSGMHKGEAPSFDRSRVASDPTYNLATGTQILAGKWKATNCVGDNLLKVVEHWYTATWAYNGLAYSNNPSNPAYSSTRGVWNPNVGGSAPYQEKVFGWMERPRSAAHAVSLPAAYVDPSKVGSSGSPPALPEPDCASPTNCTGVRTTHLSECFGGNTPDAGVVDAGVKVDAGVPDSGVKPDGGTPDAGSPDSGEPVDAGKPDAGPADAGVKPVPAPHATGQLGDAPKGGCGCTEVGAFAPWLALIALARRRNRGR